MSDIEAEIHRQMREEPPSAPPNPPPGDAPASSQAASAYVPPPPPPLPPLPPAATAPPNTKKGLFGSLGVIGILLAKYWAIVLSVLLKLKTLLVGLKFLTFGKFFITGGTMLISMLAWSTRYGWKFGVGIVLLIFIHECGHAWASRRLGHPVGLMVFMPFMGAVVTTGRARNAAEDAFIGIMGPVFGTLGGLVCCLLFALTGNLFWLALAWFCFWMNLLNLAPTVPLDGGWIVPVISPKLLLPGVIFLFVFWWRNPMVWILALMSLPRIITGWKHPNATFYKTEPRLRVIYGLSYLGLAAALALSGFLIEQTILNLGHVRV